MDTLIGVLFALFLLVLFAVPFIWIHERIQDDNRFEEEFKKYNGGNLK